MSSCWTSPERKMCSTVLYDWAKSNTTYGILCREKKCETLRDEGKLIKGIANGIEGEQGKTCFFTELTQFRGTAYTLLAPKPKVSMTLSNRGQNQGKFFMSIYFGLLSEMKICSTKGTKPSVGAGPLLPHMHRSPAYLTRFLQNDWSFSYVCIPVAHWEEYC